MHLELHSHKFIQPHVRKNHHLFQRALHPSGDQTFEQIENRYTNQKATTSIETNGLPYNIEFYRFEHGNATVRTRRITTTAPHTTAAVEERK